MSSLPEVWIDAQLPPALAVWLREEHQIEAVHVHDLDLTTASDRRIFEAASQVGAVVVTKDSDFAVLLQQRGPPPQVVWLRLGNTSNRELRSTLLAAGEPLLEVRGGGHTLLNRGHAGGVATSEVGTTKALSRLIGCGS